MTFQHGEGGRSGWTPALMLAALFALSLGPLPPPAHAQLDLKADVPDDVQSDPASTDSPLPAKCSGEFQSLKRSAADDFEFEGPVTIVCGDERIQADRLTVRAKRYMVAEGNVLLIWQGSRLFGSRMEYDMETGNGFLEDVIGQALDDYIFWAERAEKEGDDLIHLKSATVTTCTQPIPYWSFSVSSATIRLEGYARMWNVRLRATKVPLIYLPYLVWPVKSGRAAGILFPEFSSTSNRGDAITQELFIPLGESADMTLLGRYYTEAGLGGGVRLNVLPNRRGQAVLDSFYIRDDVDGGAERFRATYRQTQEFRNGFKLFADLNFVSDFDYFADFERDLDLVTSPTILAKVEFARNGAWTSINVRELRRKQLFADGSQLTQKTLPEIEWRGRTRRLGRTPFYLSFESSLASIQLDGVQQGQPINADYRRADLFPVISAPWSPTPWLDITPSVTYRHTRYTQSQDNVDDGSGNGTTVREIRNTDISRDLWSAGINIVGPKISRIYRRPGSPDSSQFKHTIEPTIGYGYQDPYDNIDDLILFDEVDRFNGAGENINYSLVQRLFARRPRKTPEAPPERGDVLMVPDSKPSETLNDDPFGNYLQEIPESKKDRNDNGDSEGDPNAAGESGGVADSSGEGADAASGAEPEAPSEPLEIATFEVRQSRSFDRELSFADLDRDGVNEETSPYGDISVIGRYNPSPTVNLDLRGRYNHLYQDFNTVTLSGGLARNKLRTNFSVVHTNGLGVVPQVTFDDMGVPTTSFVDADDNTSLNLTTGLTLFRGKLNLDVDTLYRFDTLPGQKAIPTLRWKVRYQTQCCTLYVEQFRRDFSDLSDRQDLYIRIDLTGIGRILKVSY